MSAAPGVAIDVSADADSAAQQKVSAAEMQGTSGVAQYGSANGDVHAPSISTSGGMQHKSPNGDVHAPSIGPIEPSMPSASSPANGSGHQMEAPSDAEDYTRGQPATGETQQMSQATVHHEQFATLLGASTHSRS